MHWRLREDSIRRRQTKQSTDQRLENTHIHTFFEILTRDLMLSRLACTESYHEA